MCFKKVMSKNLFFVVVLKVTAEYSRSEPDSDPLVRATDPLIGIGIRSKCHGSTTLTKIICFNFVL